VKSFFQKKLDYFQSCFTQYGIFNLMAAIVAAEKGKGKGTV